MHGANVPTNVPTLVPNVPTLVPNVATLVPNIGTKRTNFLVPTPRWCHKGRPSSYERVRTATAPHRNAPHLRLQLAATRLPLQLQLQLQVQVTPQRSSITRAKGSTRCSAEPAAEPAVEETGAWEWLQVQVIWHATDARMRVRPGHGG
eukprot:CAMPEP_0119480544 /NCGR_PEP_ID=MMETSP1344-20130328/9303_1 /TAXON_ID=236787 /ORGANISM="Florenciella parvula, Strain CCMP2471" /LENGTH=147 /DNA_ID=CAMNT_0007514861 /DNA_START=98 /DNA_END=537 /DNA_ORIENTATION=-